MVPSIEPSEPSEPYKKVRAITATVWFVIARTQHPLTGTSAAGDVRSETRHCQGTPPESPFAIGSGQYSRRAHRRMAEWPPNGHDAPMRYDERMSASVASDPTARGTGSVRAALLAGFAVVFALWLLWGYQLVRSLIQIEQNVTSVHESYVRGEQTLSKVRTNVLLGSIYLRDALIDGATPRRESYRDELMRLRGEVETLVASYVPAVSS